MVTYQALFNVWFSQNYGKLKASLCCGGAFLELYDSMCEDCFHNAYLCVHNSLRTYTDETDFSLLFRAAYRRQRKAYQTHEAKEIRPSDLFWAFLAECETDQEQNEMRSVLIDERAKAVRAYVANHFTKEQKQVFKMYFVYSCTKEQIAAYCGKSVPTITKCVKWCKDCLTCEFRNFCQMSNYINE